MSISQNSKNLFRIYESKPNVFSISQNISADIKEPKVNLKLLQIEV